MSAPTPSPTVATVLAGRIRAGRASCGLTQEQLAHEAGLTTRSIQRLENAEIVSPGIQPLLRIAQILKLSSADLLGGLAPDKPSTGHLGR